MEKKIKKKVAQNCASCPEAMIPVGEVVQWFLGFGLDTTSPFPTVAKGNHGEKFSTTIWRDARVCTWNLLCPNQSERPGGYSVGFFQVYASKQSKMHRRSYTLGVSSPRKNRLLNQGERILYAISRCLMSLQVTKSAGDGFFRNAQKGPETLQGSEAKNKGNAQQPKQHRFVCLGLRFAEISTEHKAKQFFFYSISPVNLCGKCPTCFRNSATAHFKARQVSSSRSCFWPRLTSYWQWNHRCVFPEECG